jgi:hypothetical protein
MTSTLKFSQFAIGGELQNGDLIAGLRGGVNTIFTSTGGGGGSASLTYMFTQATPVVPALYLGAAVRVDVGTGLWECTLATTVAKAEFYGFIIGITGNTYTVQFAGEAPDGIPAFSTLIAGTPYYLSDSIAGGISATPPNTLGEINLPVLWAMDGGKPLIKMSRGFIEGTASTGGGSGGSANNTATVVQPGNTFAIGDALYISADNTFSLANAYSTFNAAQAEWVITSIPIAGNTFTVQQGGKIQGIITTDDTASPITSGMMYYISPTVGQEGKLTSTEPTGAGEYSKPFYIQQVASSNTGWILDQRTLPATPATPPFITATGGVITTNGNQKIHTFNSDGNFQITAGSGNVEYLIVGGGGGGGSNNSGITSGAGGGGAGGLVSGTTAVLGIGTFPVSVGAAGAGGAGGGYNQGSDGGISSFNGNAAVGGGGGGAGGGLASSAGRNGGSGGGSSDSFSPGTGTAGQGNSGGTSNSTAGSGGGGAGAVGGNAAANNGGNGAAGSSNSISGAATTYAAGGGGAAYGAATAGTGGVGGGGNGGTNAAPPTAGSTNTGSGGGGCGNLVGAGAAGGSGVVILSYQYM